MTYIPQQPNDWLIRQTKEIESKIKSGSQYIGLEVQQEYNPVLGIPITYGLRRINGSIIYLSTKPNDSNILYMVVLLGEGQMGPVYRVFVDDIQVRFEGVFTNNPILPHKTVTKPNLFDRLRPTTSSSDELATFEYIDGRAGFDRSTLLGEVYGGLGPIYNNAAYLVCKFKYRTGIFNDLPKVTVDVFGRITTTLNGTWAQNPYNPVDHLYDYMTNTRYGAGISSSLIDTTGWTTVATTINTTKVLTQPGSSTSVNFIQNNITLDPTNKISENIKQILDDHGLVLHFSSGKYRLTLENKTDTSTAVTEDKIINGITINKSNSSTRYTSFIVDYENSRSEYYTRSVTEPARPVISAYVYTPNEIRDGTNKKVGRKNTPGITLQWLAQQTARKLLLKSRAQETFTFTALREAFQFTVGDVIKVSSTIPLLSETLMRIIRMRVNEQFEIELTCVSHNNDFYPPFSDIYASQGEAINFPPNKEIPTPTPVEPPLPENPPPAPGDPGGPPVVPPPAPKPVEIFTMDQIYRPAVQLSKTFGLSGSSLQPWPTVTGNPDWYLGEIFIQVNSRTTNWSTPLARDAVTSFAPPGHGADGSMTYSTLQSPSAGFSTFGMASILDQLSGPSYGQAGNNIYVFKQTPMITYRRQDFSEDTRYDGNAGKYQGQDYLIYTYSIKNASNPTGAGNVATTEFGWIYRGSDGVEERFVVDLTSTTTVTWYRGGSSKPTSLSYIDLIDKMPKLRYKSNPYALGGGSYGYINPRDPLTHVQHPLVSLPQTTPEIPALLGFDINWSHFGTLNRTSLFNTVRFRIFAVKFSGLPEYIGEVSGGNDVRVANAKLLRQAGLATTSKNTWKLAGLPGNLGQVA